MSCLDIVMPIWSKKNLSYLSVSQTSLQKYLDSLESGALVMLGHKVSHNVVLSIVVRDAELDATRDLKVEAVL